MGTSPLLGGSRVPERPKGTGTDALGPSDSTDSGADIRGADGATDTYDSGLDSDDTRRAPGAGADIGDANLDSDSDHGGTGERAEAGRDTLRRDAPDIAPDTIEGGDEAAQAEWDALAGDLPEAAADEQPAPAADERRRSKR